MPNPFQNYKIKKTNIKSERHLYIEQIAHLVDRSYKQIGILTADWKVSWLRDSLDYSNHQNNPVIGWWTFRKKVLTGEDL